MTEFTGGKRVNDIDFGDYVEIPQKRFGVPDEMFIHKVVGALESNTWVDAPIHWTREEKVHSKMEVVLNVICCGVDETQVFRVRQKDCKLVKR